MKLRCMYYHNSPKEGESYVVLEKETEKEIPLSAFTFLSQRKIAFLVILIEEINKKSQ